MKSQPVGECRFCHAATKGGTRCASCASRRMGLPPRKPSTRSHALHLTNDERNACRRETRRLIAKGELRKPKRCTRCRRPDEGFESKIVVHHWSYDDPRHVKFVCVRCHDEIHFRMAVAKVKAARMAKAMASEAPA